MLMVSDLHASSSRKFYFKTIFFCRGITGDEKPERSREFLGYDGVLLIVPFPSSASMRAAYYLIQKKIQWNGG
ncbi:MAG TPA: hypothetical protein DEB25_08345 [Desulfobulbaceae bacterium]|nr:hypothetical protein [Desulfobulbaceae bacterium]